MRIGIGCGVDAAKVLASAARVASAGVTIVCYGQTDDVSLGNPGDGVEICRSENPAVLMIDDLYAKRIDAAIRGSLPANETLKYLKSVYKVERLERIALLETPAGERFFFAPVGVDEGWTVEEKISFVADGRKLAKAFGITEKTAILSGGRLGDIGRHPMVDATIRDAQTVANATGAEHREILIESAVKDCGVIIAPDGISGNLIFRTLVLLGNGTGHGAPVVNIRDIFVDSSRASAGYDGILNLTISLAGKNT